MKQKLFENVGGNSFKLITESVEEVNPQAKLVREGLKKVFGSGEKSLSYKRLQGVGLGYIKSVSEAQKTAIQEARILAKEYGYTDNENSQKFVKEGPRGELPTSIGGERGWPDEAPPTNSEEKREVQIGKEIIRLCQGTDSNFPEIIALAQELIQMHGQQ